MRLLLLAGALVLAVGCGGREEPSGPQVEPFGADAVRATWVWRIAFDETLDDQTVATLASRWLTTDSDPDPVWRPPGDLPDVRAVQLRWHQEDSAAITEIGDLYNSVLCRLGRDPAGFGPEVREGWAVAREACFVLGESEAVDRLRHLLGMVPPQLPDLPVEGSVADALSPLVQKDIVVLGESLRYRFQRPGQFALAVGRLSAPELVAAPADDPTVGVGRSHWGGGLPTLVSTLGPIEQVGLAEAERAAEDNVERWRVTLESMTTPGGAQLAPSESALLLRWVRAAAYRDLGSALLASDAAAALPLLEEAAGGGARVRPGPGRDPLLLARLARARFEAGEPGRAAELLRDMAEVPGWGFVGPSADACARVAVLPSPTGPEVRR